MNKKLLLENLRNVPDYPKRASNFKMSLPYSKNLLALKK